jgi:hypothetical protein
MGYNEESIDNKLHKIALYTLHFIFLYKEKLLMTKKSMGEQLERLLTKTFVLDIEKDNIELITFLNNGVKPHLTDKKKVLVIDVLNRDEIKTAILPAEDVWDNEHYKNPVLVAGLLKFDYTD